MTVSSATSATATGADPSSAAPATGTVDKNAFLKLLVAQLSHQDPLKPMEGTEFVTQLAQFTAVEQAMAQSAKLDLLGTQLRGIASNDATSLIGRAVTVRGDTMSYDGATPANATVTLGAAATKVTATISDASGKTIRTLDLGAHAGGPLTISWDGHGEGGVTEPPGNYKLSLSAQTADGAAVPATMNVSGIVKQVSFDKGYPEVVLASGSVVPISDLVSVASPLRHRNLHTSQSPGASRPQIQRETMSGKRRPGPQERARGSVS
jgi:flagellar basal-body rod modification protein FlgD